MKTLLKTLLLGALSITVSKAATVIGDPFFDPTLGGATSQAQWTDFSATANPGYPGYPGVGPWPSPIAAQSTSGSTAAALNRLSGSAYPAGSSLYSPSGSVLAVQESSPIAGLQTIILQIQSGSDFSGGFPLLNYNGGTQGVAATFTALSDQTQNGTFTPPGGSPQPVYVDTYAMQWDLSGIIAPITSFELTWSPGAHDQLYAVQLDQSDAVNSSNSLPSPVPEPATSGLAALGGLLLILRRKRD